VTTCKIEDCGKSAFCRGWCSQHYTRWQRHGDPLITTRTPPMAPGATERHCPRCLSSKPVGEFGTRASGVPMGYCSQCEAEYQRSYSQTEDGAARRKAAALRYSASDKRHDLELHKRYGISLEQFRQMLDVQGGKCAICKVGHPGGDAGRRWNVDHCHSTGKVRGLLCANCNHGLGKFQDDPEILRQAIAYLT
jgi:hypothetical protein